MCPHTKSSIPSSVSELIILQVHAIVDDLSLLEDSVVPFDLLYLPTVRQQNTKDGQWGIDHPQQARVTDSSKGQYDIRESLQFWGIVDSDQVYPVTVQGLHQSYTMAKKGLLKTSPGYFAFISHRIALS
jgi:hypothetical protein